MMTNNEIKMMTNNEIKWLRTTLKEYKLLDDFNNEMWKYLKPSKIKVPFFWKQKLWDELRQYGTVMFGDTAVWVFSPLHKGTVSDRLKEINSLLYSIAYIKRNFIVRRCILSLKKKNGGLYKHIMDSWDNKSLNPNLDETLSTVISSYVNLDIVVNCHKDFEETLMLNVFCQWDRNFLSNYHHQQLLRKMRKSSVSHRNQH